MKAGLLPKVAIAVIVLSVGILFLSGQTSQVAAQPYFGHDGCYPYYTYYYGYYNMSYYWWNYGYPYYYYSYYSYPYNCYYGYDYYSYSPPTPTNYQLTVATDPGTLGTTTGSGSYVSGSSASFSVNSNMIQTSPNTRYVFSHWSGNYSGVGTSGSVVMNGAMKIIAVYQLQYLLSVAAQPGSAPMSQGSGWYNAGDSVTLSAAGQVLGGQDGSRLVFTGWNVDGKNLQSGISLVLKMDSAHSATAQYKQQYYLKVATDQGVAYGEGWYDAGSTAQIYVSTPASTSYGVNVVFNGWQGDVQASSQSASVLMDGPKSAIASWRTDATVLNLTIILGIIAAFLIAGGILAYAALGRRKTYSQPTQTVPPRESKQTQASHPSNAPTRHRKKETSENTNSTEQSS
jgi:hypothetical protein